MTMSADVYDDYLTLMWTVIANGKTEVIDEHNDLYELGAKNKVMCTCSCIAHLLTCMDLKYLF